MPYTAIADADRDAESPLSDDLFQFIDEDLDWLKSTLSDGATAAQDINANKITLRAAGTALTVDNNALVSGNMTVSGTLSTGVFFSSEQLLWLFSI